MRYIYLINENVNILLKNSAQYKPSKSIANFIKCSFAATGKNCAPNPLEYYQIIHNFLETSALDKENGQK